MQLLSMVCPKCGANLEINPTLKEAFCQYCGAKLLIDGMQATNQMGQPVADRNLLELLQSIAPVLADKEAVIPHLNQKQKSLQYLENKASKPIVPIEALNDKINSYISPQYEKIFLIFGIICTVLSTLSVYFIPLILFSPVAFCFVFLYLQIKERAKTAKLIERTKTEVSELSQKMNSYNEALSKYSTDVIPPIYQTAEAVDFFLAALSNQRATTMQQAINLYEEDKRNKKMDAMQKQQLARLENLESLAQENAALRAQMNSKQNTKK